MYSYLDIGHWAFAASAQLIVTCAKLKLRWKHFRSLDLLPILITGSLTSPEDNVLLCVDMSAAAVRAGELLCFDFGRLPTFLFDCASSIGQL
jgi:hypothetical protein